ncbi:unnamed protein product [Brassica napus]|uniref:(rape) hypothetical protein n=1 Tax=Brassica napus TaxID=3708 RepID=A0A817AS90_BRANA|nr:unnamed protein product [Brassica napus]
MAVPTILLADFKAGRHSNTFRVRMFRFWERRTHDLSVSWVSHAPQLLAMDVEPNVTSPPAITRRTKPDLRKLVTEEMLQSDGQNLIMIVGGANMIGWPEKMIDDELEIVRNAGVVQLQREIPASINIQFAKVGGGCVAGCEESRCAGHLTWKEWIPQSLMSYWIQLTSCNIMKLSYVA